MKKAFLALFASAVLVSCGSYSPEATLVQKFENNDKLEIAEAKITSTYTYKDSCEVLQTAFDKEKTKMIEEQKATVEKCKTSVTNMQKAVATSRRSMKKTFQSQLEMAESTLKEQEEALAKLEKGDFSMTSLEMQSQLIKSLEEKKDEIIGHVLEIHMKEDGKDISKKYLLSPDKKQILRKK